MADSLPWQRKFSYNHSICKFEVVSWLKSSRLQTTHLTRAELKEFNWLDTDTHQSFSLPFVFLYVFLSQFHTISRKINNRNNFTKIRKWKIENLFWFHEKNEIYLKRWFLIKKEDLLFQIIFEKNLKIENYYGLMKGWIYLVHNSQIK